MNEASPFEPSLVGAIWRDRFLVGVVVLVFVVLAIGYAVTRPVTYAATASVLVDDPRQEGTDPAERFVADQVAVFNSTNVAREAARIDRASENPTGMTVDDYLNNVTVGASARDSNLVRATMVAPDARVALAGADNVVQAYQSVVRTNAENRVKGPIEQIDAELADMATERTSVEGQLNEVPPPTGGRLQGLEQRLAQLIDRQDALEINRQTFDAEVSESTQTVELYSPATRATKSSLKDSARIIVLAIMLGGLAGGGLAYVRSTRRPAFYKPHEPELALDAPLLAEVPSFSHRSARALPVLEQPTSGAAHAFRYAGAAVEIQRAASGARCMVVTSARQGEGRTVTVANVGLALAESGVETLVVDADLETRGLTRMLRGAPAMGQGWLDVLAGRALLAGVVAPVPVGHGAAAMGMLSAGEARVSAAEFFGSDKFRPRFEVLLAELRDRYDVVLIDVPALLEVTYTAALASCADGVLAVVDHGGSVNDQEEVVRRLRLIGTPPVGYVYNHLPRLRSSAPAAPSWSLPHEPEMLPSSVAYAPPGPNLTVTPAVSHAQSPASEPAQPVLRSAGRRDTATSWECRCGRHNAIALEHCPRCGRGQDAARVRRAEG